MSRWYELSIEGSEEALEEFLAGQRAMEDGLAILGSELRLKSESLSERILDALGAKTHHLLFSPGDHARMLVEALADRSDLRLERLREVEGGSFSFEAKAFARDVARTIKDALHDDLPPGISFEDVQESETVEPEAKGVELYAPAHDYVYRASGAVRGRLSGVLEMHRRLEEMEFCKPGEIEIEAREVAEVRA
jgi:hypothetical protein